MSSKLDKVLASFVKTVEEAPDREEPPASEEKLHQHLESAKAGWSARKNNNVVPLKQLHLFSDDARSVPNSFLRSAMFAAVKERRSMQRELLEAQDGIEIRFTGIQLNQSDLDVWEQALMLASEHKLGTRCEFAIKGFLKDLGRQTGKSQREGLKDSLARLMGCGLEITHNGLTYGGSLLEFWRDDDAEVYRLEINPKMKAMYDAGTTYTNWQERKKLGNKPLAKWLHGYLASHAAPIPMKVETYMRLSGSSTSEVWKFKQNLEKALKDLAAIGAIVSYEITESGLVKIKRKPTKSQRRHLTRAKPRK